MATSLLEVRRLSISYRNPGGDARAVRDVSLSLSPGETLALVGESGCGKSTIARSLMGLLSSRETEASGELRFEGKDLPLHSSSDWRGIQGRRIGMVFQDPRATLNPVLTIGEHLVETLRAHQALSASAARAKGMELLREVGIPDPAGAMHRHPFELSGGMCQRVAIALGVCNQPSLLLADEPTSALDPTIQAQILGLLRSLRARHGLAVLLITHDLPLVAGFADRVLVMYHGRIVEEAPAPALFTRALHPYTRGLLEALPALGRSEAAPLRAIPGNPPRAREELPGCPFAPRCAWAEAACTEAFPAPVPVSREHWAACIKAEGGS